MQINRWVGRVATAFCFLTLTSGLATAQTNQGELAGSVLDTSGAVVSGAQITAVNDAKGTTYKTTSTGNGYYRFPSIELGRYTITVSAAGFKQAVGTGVEVQVGTVTGFDAHLDVGGTNETVTVDANAPTIQTESSDVGGVVTTRQVLELPLALGGVGNLRSPEAFVFLIPGTVGPGSGNSPNGIFISKIGGGQNFGNEVLIDGLSQTRSENGSSFDEEAPSVEAISEFKVTTSTPAAEFGRTTGGIENFVTKSGTNQYHGTAYEIFRNEVLDANDWFNAGDKYIYCQPDDSACRARYERGSDKKHDYGGNIGGPLSIPHLYNAKDRTFGFFSWEQYQQNIGGGTATTVPTAAERNGDFSDRLQGPTGQTNPCDGTPLFNGQIFDPLTDKTVVVPNPAGGTLTVRCRSAFPGNAIPQNRFSQVAINALKFYPLPQNGNLQNNYINGAPYPIYNTTYTIRIDQNVSTRNKIWGTYSTRENGSLKAPRTFPDPVDPVQWNQDFLTHFFRTGWDFVISPSLLNHAILGTNRSNSKNFHAGSQGKTNYAAELGIGNINYTNFPVINPNAEGIPQLSKAQADDNVDNGIRFTDSVNWQKGRNSFKIGFDYRYQQYSNLAFDNLAGTFNFSGNQTKASDNGNFNSGTGNGLASLLLGLVDDGNLSERLHQPRWISNYWAGFIQDDLKISPQLTLNLGVRYDVDQPRKEAQNLTSNFSLTAIDPHNGLPGALVFAPTCHCNPRWADTWYKDIAPRIGFAYSPSQFHNKTVVRGGFAILYGPLQYADFGGSMVTGYSANPDFGSDGFNPSFTIDSGFPQFTPPPNLDPGQLDNGNASAPQFVGGSYIAAKYGRPAMVNQWNMQVQQEVAKDLIFTIGYVGQRSQNLRSGIENINNINRSNFSRGDQLTQFDLGAAGVAQPYPSFNGQVQQALRPFPQYGFIATDCCLQNVGHSSYDAMIVTLERRFSSGLNLQASYTWSKTVTDADSALPGINGGVNQEQDPFDHRNAKSLSIQDIPNTFVLSYIYELPFGRHHNFLNQSRLLDLVVGGWQIGAVHRYQSGEPISFGCADGIPGWDNCISFSRVPGSSLSSHLKHGNFHELDILNAQGINRQGPDPTIDSIFNGLLRKDNAAYSALQVAPALYSQNAPPNRNGGPFSLGNVPRVTGEVRNFRFYNEDFSIIKNLHLTERFTFQLKGELLDALNRHNFATPDTQPYNNDFGVPRSVIGGPTDGHREVQFTGRVIF
jgi:hypothetical protein